MTFGVADFVAGFGSSSGQLTGSTHRRVLRYYCEYGIMSTNECQRFGLCLVFVIWSSGWRMVIVATYGSRNSIGWILSVDAGVFSDYP
jgi:hypothetical protein